jgi:hypothetical protein
MEKDWVRVSDTTVELYQHKLYGVWLAFIDGAPQLFSLDHASANDVIAMLRSLPADTVRERQKRANALGALPAAGSTGS